MSFWDIVSYGVLLAFLFIWEVAWFLLGQWQSALSTRFLYILPLTIWASLRRGRALAQWSGCPIMEFIPCHTYVHARGKDVSTFDPSQACYLSPYTCLCMYVLPRTHEDTSYQP